MSVSGSGYGGYWCVRVLVQDVGVGIGVWTCVCRCWYGCVRMRLWVCQGVGVTECGCRRVEQSCGRLHRPARRPRLLLHQVGWMWCGCVRMWVYHCGYMCENGFECFKVLRLHQSVWVLWLSPLSLRLCRMVDTLSSSSLSSLIHGVSHPFL